MGSSTDIAGFKHSPKVTECRLDKITYERDHIVKLASDDQPEKYTFSDIFRESNQPKEYSPLFTKPVSSAGIHYSNSLVCIELCQTEYYDYLIKREENGKIEVLYDGHCEHCYLDDTVRTNKKYIYSVTPYYIGRSGERHYGKEIVLPSVYTKQTENKPPENWWKN